MYFVSHQIRALNLACSVKLENLGQRATNGGATRAGYLSRCYKMTTAIANPRYTIEKGIKEVGAMILGLKAGASIIGKSIFGIKF